MSVSRFMRASLAASATAIMATVAAAQPSEQMAEVKVVANKPVTAQGRTTAGRPGVVVQLSRVVSYADLNVATPSGATELEKRVNDAAKSVCKELEKLYPAGSSAELGSGSCVADAIKGATPQVQAAIAAAEKGVRSAQAPK